MTRSLSLCTSLLLAAAAAQAQPAPPQAAPKWEGAVGLTGGYRPEYEGGSRWKFGVTPALFLRYGRFTLTNASGFATSRSDDLVRGLGMDVVQGSRLRVNLSLRVDAGRNDGTSSALAGLGDIKPTLRARLNATYRFDAAWRVSASWGTDLLGRGGGQLGDVGIAHDWQLAPLTRLTLGSTVALADRRYMRTYYGISTEQAARTNHAVYTPGAGLRDARVYANLRHDIGHDWIVLGGLYAARLLGPAADSPLTTQRDGWGVSGGVAWRF